ncbi:PTS fructose transporter subunit IIA [Enterococcus faecium]|nr:PTS system fructose specific IIA component [Enterococcus faecium 1,231,410]EFR69665.1 PTS system fructose IIA component [Enterococcus faecium TX0133a01]EPI23646.1 PTS system fructose IIA component [Enterococcus faecium OC2A-1]KAF3380076.1 PTS fructose transporter subunit IIA [Enterococcus faecium]ONN34089.1 PTS fructose transporter subunit IIA [Enterococcus faecium]
MKMATIILASHGEFAQGLKQTATMIIGDSVPIHALSAFRDEDESILVQIKKLLATIDIEETYILTDILGGSVNNDMLTIIKEYEGLQLITGMNLPLVISIATYNGKIGESELEKLIRESQQSVIDCRKLLVEQLTGGDDL